MYRIVSDIWIASPVSVAAFTQVSRILALLGPLGSVQLSIVTQIVYNFLLSRATTGRDFFLAVPINMFMMTGYAAMQSIVMLEGSKTGMAQGELQGAISSLQTMCSVVAPIVPSPRNVCGCTPTTGSCAFAFDQGLMSHMFMCTGMVKGVRVGCSTRQTWSRFLLGAGRSAGGAAGDVIRLADISRRHRRWQKGGQLTKHQCTFTGLHRGVLKQLPFAVFISTWP